MTSGNPSVKKDWTTLEVIEWTQGYFREKGIEKARLEAEILLAHVIGCKRIDLYVRFEKKLQQEILQQYRELVQKRGQHRPLAYLTNAAPFFENKFYVDERVLIPRPDTETLVEKALSVCSQEPEKEWLLVDIGCGSGCIGLSLAGRLPRAEALLTDISSDALEVARINTEQLGLTERVRCLQGDLFAPLAPTGPFDLIASNPPYIGECEKASLMQEVRDYEPAQALFAGSDGLDVIRSLLVEAPQYLKSGGFLLMEVGYQQKEAVDTLASTAGFAQWGWTQDLSGIDRVLSLKK